MLTGQVGPSLATFRRQLQVLLLPGFFPSGLVVLVTTSVGTKLAAPRRARVREEMVLTIAARLELSRVRALWHVWCGVFRQQGSEQRGNRLGSYATLFVRDNAAGIGRKRDDALDPDADLVATDSFGAQERPPALA
jgi:hypothetical protein